MHRSLLSAVLSVSVLFSTLVAAHAVQAATLTVANNGLDSDTCGSSAAPCRSISQAIAHASEGDTLVVGPGRYGDLNGNGSFGDPGDEDAEVGGGCTCMVKINKPLKLVSSDGAAVTVLDVGGADLGAVVIQADSVVFGKQGQGFTLAQARREGLLLQANNVTVVGNVAIGSGTNGNDAFSIDGSGHAISHNVALGNARAGFGVHGSGHVVSDNVASGNRFGFDLTFSGQFTHNVASSNGDTGGIAVNARGLDIHRNAINGNEGRGIMVFSSDMPLTENNIFGNGTNEDNCGIINNTGTVLMAPNNFWGAATGPGPDPADAVCGGHPDLTLVDPVATKPFNISVKSGF